MNTPRRYWFRLHEKGGKFHEVPAHHTAEALMDAYLKKAEIAADRKGPLCRSVDRHRELTGRCGSRKPELVEILDNLDSCDHL